MSNIPATSLVPGVSVRIDNSLANTSLGETFKTIVIGQKTSAGTTTANTLTQVFSAEEAKTLAGVGSNLAEMFDSGWFKTNTTNEVFMVALEDDGGATAATLELTPTASSAEAGTIYMYVNGNLIRVGTSDDDAVSDITAAITEAVNADVDLPVTAADGTTIVTLTAKNGGTLGNQIDVRFNVNVNESFPTGVSVASAVGSAGATDPDIADAIAAIPDEIYNLFVNPYTDSTNMTALATELERRWGNTVQLDGHAIQAYGGTTSVVATYGDTLNSQYFTVIDSGKDTMQPEYVWAASTGGLMAGNASVDPALPFSSLEISGVTGDDEADRRNYSEKNTLLNAGISTHMVLTDGSVTVGRLVTTYKTNGVGAEDTSYQNTNTLFNLSYLRQSYITHKQTTFAQRKLADDGTVFGSGQPVVTPSINKGDTLALYQTWINLGLVEDIDAFEETLVSERDEINRSRINETMQPILVGQFYQIDNTLQFIV